MTIARRQISLEPAGYRKSQLFQQRHGSLFEPVCPNASGHESRNLQDVRDLLRVKAPEGHRKSRPKLPRNSACMDRWYGLNDQYEGYFTNFINNGDACDNTPSTVAGKRGNSSTHGGGR